MENFVLSLSFVLFFLFSTYGLGHLVTHLIYKEEAPGPAYATTLGVAAWTIYGGVLNLLGLVFPLVLISSLILGAGFAVFFIYRNIFLKRSEPSTGSGSYSGISQTPRLKLETALFALVLLSVLLFSVFHLMPSSSFNFHDDFNSYLYLSVQLLAEGGFPRNPFSAFGFNNLGGQEFLRAFSLLFFDVRYSNAFDTVICLFLGLALTIEYANHLKAKLSVAVAAAILYLVINPQIVNTSSVYSGSVLIMGLILSGLYPTGRHDSFETPSLSNIIKTAVPAGLFLSALTTLKANLIIFAFLFFFTKLLLELLFSNTKKLVLYANSSIAIIGFLFVLPWLLAPSSKYFGALSARLFNGSTADPVSTQAETSHRVTYDISALFSTKDTFYGGGFSDYLSLFFLLFGILLVCLLIFAKKTGRLPISEASVIAAAAVTPIFSIFIMVGMTDSADTALRYNAPLLIAIAPIALLFIAVRYTPPTQTWFTHVPSAFLGFALIVIGMFSRSFMDRIERIAHENHVLSFPVGRMYIRDSIASLSKTRGDKIRKAQSATEQGTSILAWIATPFHLDFARNNITVFESASADVPDFPLDTDVKTLWKFLRTNGFDYIFWQPGGFGVKDSNWFRGKSGLGVDRTLFLQGSMFNLSKATKLVHKRSSLWVLDIRKFNDIN